MNKFEKWLYILFDKTSGLKNLIISYKEKGMDLERIKKEKEIIELELDLIEKDQENSSEIQLKCKKISKELKTIKSLNQFKKIKSKKLLLEIDVLEEKVKRIAENFRKEEITIEKKDKYKNELLSIKHKDNNEDMDIMEIIKNLEKKFYQLKEILFDKDNRKINKISENHLLYCEKELLKLKYSVDVDEKTEKKVDKKKDKEICKIEKIIRENRIFDSIYEGHKFSKILKEKRKVLEKKKTIKSSGFFYHQYLIGIFIIMFSSVGMIVLKNFFIENINILTITILVFIFIFIFIFVDIKLSFFIIVELFIIIIFPKKYEFILLLFALISILILIYEYIKPDFFVFFCHFFILGELIYFICQIMINLGKIILELLNLYSIENNQEIINDILKIGTILLLLFFILYFPTLINIFKIEKIASIKMNINQGMRLFVGIVSLFFVCSINKNNENINLENTDFVVDIKIPNFETAKGRILIGGEEIPIEVKGNKIKTENRNKIEEKDIIVNVGNDEIKIMNCTKNNCESTKKGKVINLKNSSFILFENNEKKHEYECENKYNSSKLIEKFYKEDEKVKNIHKIINGNILKGKILKIEEEYYIYNESTISTLKNLEYTIYPIRKLFLSVIFFIILYLLFKGNKDYYDNQKKKREERKRFVKFLIGKDVEKYKRNKLEEEIKELESIFNFSIFKMFFTIPPLITIIFGVFNFIQKPEINFKINPYSAFSITLLVVLIATIILLIFIRFLVQKIIEMIFFPRNEFFEFTEIILEIIEENNVVV